MAVDVDSLIMNVGQRMKGDEERKGCWSVSRMDMVVVALPRRKVVPMEESLHGLLRLVNELFCHGGSTAARHGHDKWQLLMKPNIGVMQALKARRGWDEKR